MLITLLAGITIPRIEVITPMFAWQECLKCHDSEVGELFGAFSYETFFHAK